MEEVEGSAIDKNVFQVALQTEVVLVMTLQMCFSTKNWTIINFASKSLLSYTLTSLSRPFGAFIVPLLYFL